MVKFFHCKNLNTKYNVFVCTAFSFMYSRNDNENYLLDFV